MKFLILIIAHVYPPYGDNIGVFSAEVDSREECQAVFEDFKANSPMIKHYYLLGKNPVYHMQCMEIYK